MTSRMTTDGVTAQRDGAWLTVAIVGRVTKPAVDEFARHLREAITAGEPYVVVFDRSAMTAPTADGRTALEAWEDELMPEVARTVTGWADVYDSRRARALQESDRGGADAGYPHRIFDDPAAARSWCRELLASPTSTGTARP
ncbi:MAG: hypothetical protein ACRCYR_17055 [Phycicoccus sp.]